MFAFSCRLIFSSGDVAACLAFCSALIWANDRVDVERGISEVNGRLSHPEQVRKWTVLPNDLSIQGGELTGNLKLKRQAITRRFGGLIAAMYDGKTMAAGGMASAGRTA